MEQEGRDDRSGGEPKQDGHGGWEMGDHSSRLEVLEAQLQRSNREDERRKQKDACVRAKAAKVDFVKVHVTIGRSSLFGPTPLFSVLRF